jgi:hypothetical protein
MSSLEGIIQEALKDILQQNLETAKLACQQRAKFEGWLKFELANALFRKHPVFDNVILEDSYVSNGKDSSRRRSDISFLFNGNKWYVEMKTANANWRDRDLENLVRPITINMKNIAEDIHVLKRKSMPSHGMSVFCIFPVPDRLWKSTREKLNYHLRKIEATCDLAEGTIIRNANYVQIAPTFGICTFAVAVS